MKSNAKSSITLPKEELRVVERLMKATGAKTKVAVIRQGIRLLEQRVDRVRLRDEYRLASSLVSQSSAEAVEEFDELASDGLD